MSKPNQQVHEPPIQPTSTQSEEFDVFQHFVNSGFIDEIPENGEAPLPNFNPSPTKGKPASEIIIEDRGK